MTKKLQVYRCEICGNIVEVLHPGKGELVCCGQPMKLLEEKRGEEGKEKHLPVVKKTEQGIKVKVGSVPHPMEEKHYIEWIEIQSEEEICRQFLSPGNLSEATFPLKVEKVSARGYCNIHGLWKS